MALDKLEWVGVIESGTGRRDGVMEHSCIFREVGVVGR